MSDPHRLLTEGTDDFERALLRSWEGEQPSSAARERALAIAGMGAIALAAASKGMAAGSIAPKALAGAAVLKWIAVGALLAAGAGGTYAYVRHTRASVASAPLASPATALAPTGVPPIAQTVAPTTDLAPTAPRAEIPPMSDTPTTASARSTTHPTPRAASTLGEQVTLLDRARRALGDGDPRAARRAVDEYQARYPHGALAEEAEVVRIEALLAEGDRTAASRAAARFLAAHPESPHASRVRALVGDP